MLMTNTGQFGPVHPPIGAFSPQGGAPGVLPPGVIPPQGGGPPLGVGSPAPMPMPQPGLGPHLGGGLGLGGAPVGAPPHFGGGLGLGGPMANQFALAGALRRGIGPLRGSTS